MKWTIWTTTEPLPPGQATKAQGYSRWGSDLKKATPTTILHPLKTLLINNLPVRRRQLRIHTLPHPLITSKPMQLGQLLYQLILSSTQTLTYLRSHPP